MKDPIERQDIIKELESWLKVEGYSEGELNIIKAVLYELQSLPSAQPEIIRCKDCKFYSPINRETKTGICNLTMHQNFGDNWFCAGAERRTDEQIREFRL